MSSICKLCQQPSELRKSHIIPEFCYKATYDDHHRAHVVKSDELRDYLVQKGIREQLLCDQCEGRFSKLELKFKKFWYDNKALPNVIEGQSVTIDNYNYSDFKLFHLSILWRASVASIRPFTGVNLGPYESIVREMLLSENPGSELDMPIWAMVVVNDNNEVVHGLVSGAYPSRLEHSHLYYMCYAGCEWNFIIAKNFKNKLIQAYPGVDRPMLIAKSYFNSTNTIDMIRKQRAQN